MDDSERFERLNEILSELDDLSKDNIILIEGSKDRRALKALGLDDIRCIEVQSEGGPLRAAERVHAEGCGAVVLSDWDTRGDRIASDLMCQLDALCVKYDISVRLALRSLCIKDIKDVESLDSFYFRLRSIVTDNNGERTDVSEAGRMFIVMEGIDGSGKTTVVRRLKEHFESEGRKVITTAEPTDGAIGRLVGDTDGLTPETEALLFTADRAYHTEQIKGWLADGYTVITDRYLGSTLAYQSAAGMDYQWLRSINSKATIEPDITILMDIDPEAALERIGRRGEGMSRFERLGYQRKVRETYRKIAGEYGYVTVDASRPIDEVACDVLSIISKKES